MMLTFALYKSPAFRKFVTQTGVKQTRRSRRRIDVSTRDDQGTTSTPIPAPPTTSILLPEAVDH
jgi:HAMP domain-containing protein